MITLSKVIKIVSCENPSDSMVEEIDDVAKDVSMHLENTKYSDSLIQITQSAGPSNRWDRSYDDCYYISFEVPGKKVTSNTYDYLVNKLKYIFDIEEEDVYCNVESFVNAPVNKDVTSETKYEEIGCYEFEISRGVMGYGGFDE